MKILILGGTQFVGLVTAQEAVRRGHDVTILNRGSRPAPKGVRAVVGDRRAPNGYAGLDGIHFDAVIDTWQNEPVVVKGLLDALRGRMGHYIYVSTISTYKFVAGTPPFDEDTPQYGPNSPAEDYINDKVAGEMEALQSGVPTLIARPGVILGREEGLPGRLGWWLSRMERGGPTLALGPRDLNMQFIDVRDVANFLVDGAEKRLSGAYNVVSEPGHMTYGSFLDVINETAGNKAELCWLAQEQFQETDVTYWKELPISIPLKVSFIYQATPKKALAAGLKVRPARDTIQDTWDWLKDPDTVFQSTEPLGLDPIKEAKVLKEYLNK